VIRSFNSKETAAIFNLIGSKKFPLALQQIARRKLKMLHHSQTITDLRVPPGNRLEKLSGAWLGFWSIRINDQWRICFRWVDGDAFDVEITDYH
jgi:proteic killer suppression protein